MFPGASRATFAVSSGAPMAKTAQQRRADPDFSATSTEPEAPALAGHGNAAAIEVLVPRLVQGGGGFLYQQSPDGAILVLAGPARVGERYTSGDVWDAITSEIGPHPATLRPDAPLAPAPEPSLIDEIGATLGGLWDGAVETVGDGVEAARGLWDGARDAARGVADWATGDPEHEEDPGGPPASDVDRERERLLGGGKTDNLDAALDLAENTHPAHSSDGVADPVSDGAVRKAKLLAGKGDELATLKCSEFTIAALVEAGWDLKADFRDFATGLEVAYEDRPGKLYWVQRFDVANLFEEATKAVLDAQHGDCERVEPGSERAVALGVGDRTESFLLSTKDSFIGMDASANDEFGAGLVAVALGGIEVSPEARKPGDLQQTLKTVDGRFTGGGHSSTVYEVQGTGVAELGASDGPSIRGTVGSPGPVGSLAAGWYQIPADSKLRWVVGPETNPARVATLAAKDIQVVDSNNGREDADGNRDATGIGRSFEKKDSPVLSNGRLPTSRWISWAADESVRPVADLASEE